MSLDTRHTDLTQDSNRGPPSETTGQQNQIKEGHMFRRRGGSTRAGTILLAAGAIAALTAPGLARPART